MERRITLTPAMRARRAGEKVGCALVDVGRVDEAPFDIEGEIYSESVLMAVVAPDARSGVFARLCRYPSAGTAWVWLYVLTPANRRCHVDDKLPCSTGVLDTERDDLAYTAQPGLEGVWERRGARAAPRGAHASIALQDVEVDVELSPRHAPGASLPGRSEVLGTAVARVTVGTSAPVEIAGYGQWHEQHQTAPRFRTPFTYASLQGDGLGVLGLIGPRASLGFVRGSEGDRRLVRAAIGEPDADGRHRLELETEDGQSLAGVAAVGHAYSLPLYGRRWRGTFVTAEVDGRPLAGFINRWRPDAPPFVENP